MTSTETRMETRSHISSEDKSTPKNNNGSNTTSRSNVTANFQSTHHESDRITSGENTNYLLSSDDDDDTLSNKSENGEDGENEDGDVLIDTPLGSYNDQNSLPDDTSDFKSGNLEDSNKPINDTKRDQRHEGSPVFYLEPSDWEKANMKKAMDHYRSASSPLSSNPKIEDSASSHNYLTSSKPNSCPRIPSPLSLVIPSNGTSGVKKSTHPPCRRLLSPQTVYNPLLSRLHQSESMQTLPEYSSCDCTGSNKTGERIRSFSSSSNKSCNNIYRQSFGSGSFSGRVSPLARSESVFFASPVKRGSVANETMGIPINNRSTGQHHKRSPATFNHMRHRKTAIPLLCSRSAAMVRYLFCITTKLMKWRLTKIVIFNISFFIRLIIRKQKITVYFEFYIQHYI